MKVVLLLVAALLGQAFEAASIKPSAPDASNGSAFDYQPGGLRVRNGTLKGLIESAYDVRDFQIAGGPSWLDVDRFDVIARSGSSTESLPPPEAMKATRVRLQSLLAERFHLALHREMREQQEYALTIAKGGPKLVAVSGPVMPRAGINASNGHMIGTQATIANLVFGLSRRLGRPVIDRTQLHERYSFELSWQELGADRDSGDAPSIFTAVQEQLGLRLESIKGPVETIVVDRADRPSAD